MDVFEKSVAFAIKAHEGQTRKKEGIPFILHPCEAAAIAGTLTNDRDILAAVMLHDTVEDTDATIEDIRREFGERVAELVAKETENAYEGMAREDSWRLRKEESLEQLRNTDDFGVKVMWMADKLSNIRSFFRLWLREGDRLFDNFHQKDIKQQEWYYRTVAELLTNFEGTPAYLEYAYLVDVVFGGLDDES
jgi:(p)ppGpp synthase/HD superfamily hydrolase